MSFDPLYVFVRRSVQTVRDSDKNNVKRKVPESVNFTCCRDANVKPVEIKVCTFANVSDVIKKVPSLVIYYEGLGFCELGPTTVPLIAPPRWHMKTLQHTNYTCYLLSSMFATETTVC